MCGVMEGRVPGGVVAGGMQVRKEARGRCGRVFGWGGCQTSVSGSWTSCVSSIRVLIPHPMALLPRSCLLLSCRSLAAVVSVISAGLLLLVYGETQFHLVGRWVGGQAPIVWHVRMRSRRQGLAYGHVGQACVSYCPCL